MSKISRRGLFGWMAAFAAASPVIARARTIPGAPPEAFNYANRTGVEYVPLKVRLPSNYVARHFQIGDKVTWTDMKGDPWTITGMTDG